MKTQLTILMVVALAVGVLSPTSNAALVLTLDDGTNHVTVSDLDSDGMVSFSGPLAAGSPWIANITTGFSKPFPGYDFPNQAILHLNSVDATSSSGGTLRITLADDGYTLVPPPVGGFAVLTSEVSVTTNGTAWFRQTWASETGAVVPLEHGPFVNGSYADTKVAAVPYSGPFSLTELAEITHEGAKTSSFDFESTVVPVPGAILLGFLGLGAAGLKLRRFA